MTRFLVIDLDKCTGCRNCELACSAKNTRSFNPRRSRIQVLKREKQNLILPMVCLQCQNPLCEEACPAGAIVMNDFNVLTVIDSVCIGCETCVTACIYGGIAMDPVSFKAIKCDLCNGEPACIKACEYGAISINSDDEGMLARLHGIERARQAITLEEVAK